MELGAIAWLIALVGLAIAAVWLMVSNRELRRSIDMPDGDVFYRDEYEKSYEKEGNEGALYDEEIGLVGRPDYIFNDEGSLVPVEIKSTKAPKTPYPSHILQVAAYCWLVETVYGERPTHGIIQYNNQSFDVPYTEELEIDLINTINAMREDFYSEDVPRSHNVKTRCRACGVREYCGDRLA